jgi:hypothetical protein
MGTLAGAVSGSQTITQDQIEYQGEPLLDPRYTDDGAVELVIQDARRARVWLDQKQWALHWRESDVLYQSPRTNAVFEGSTVSRANVSRFTVAKHVNSLVPGMKSGIFYENPPFLIRPRPATSETTARAKTALYGALLDKCKFEDVAEKAMESQCTFGTVVVKIGWEKETKIKKVRSPRAAPVRMKLPLGGELLIHTKESEELVVTDTPVTRQGPTIELCELGTVLWDPTWNDANNLHKGAKYVVHVSYPTYNDLNALREQKVFDEKGKQVGGYDIPPEQDLRDYFFQRGDNGVGTASQVKESLGSQNYMVHHAQGEEMPASADPLERPLMMLERTDQQNVYTVLTDDWERGVIIRNEEHSLPFINFLSANFWNIPNAGPGLGCGRMAGSDQRIEKGLTDALLDILSYSCNPMYARSRGANAPTQQIRQRLGGIVDVDVLGNQRVQDVFGIIEPPKIPPEVFATLQLSAQTAQSTTGADEAFTQGSLPGRGGSSAARTATGAGGIIAANAGKIQGPVGHFVKGILIPFIEFVDFMVKQRMTPQEIRQILGDELGLAFDLDAKNFYDSDDRYECLAGAHLAAKKAMAQALPLMVQIFENQPLVQQLNAIGYVIDVRMLLEMFMEVSEWKNARELIRPMTPQEQQKYNQQNNPGAMKLQNQIATIGARHQAKSEEIDQKEEAGMARDMVSKANDQAASWDERKWERDAIAGSVWAPS